MTSAVLAATPEKRAVAVRQVRRNVKRVANRSAADSARLLRILNDTRARLLAELDHGTEFAQSQRRAMLRSIDVQVARMRQDMQPVLSKSLLDAIRQGDADAASYAADLDVEVFTLQTAIDPGLVDFASRNSVELVDQISARLRSDLRRSVERGAQGTSTPADVAREIGTVVEKAGRPKGRFGSIATQVERIHRTEVARVYEGANEARQQRVARESPFEMQKTWIATPGPRTRPSHWRMNRATVPAHEHFNFGAAAPWHLGSYEEAQRRGGDLGLKVSGPQDSVLPAAEAVNCRCTRGMRKGERKENR